MCATSIQHVDVHRPSRIRGVVPPARAAIEHDLEHAERRAAQPNGSAEPDG